MTIGIVLLAALLFVVYEVRADRKVRRATEGATPVVIVRGLKPRWWRGLLGKAVSLAVTGAVLAALTMAAGHVHPSGPSRDPERAWPFVTTPPASASTGRGR